MNYVTAEELVGKAANKYEAVVIVALRARQLNQLEKKRTEVQVVGEDEETEVKKEKVTVVAVNELVEGRIHFRREEG